MSPLFFGLYYYSQQTRVTLPLLNVRAEASIKELAAQVKLTQTYGNDADFPIEATYSFPIPVRAAVCSFVMIKQDGTRVVGRVQEKEEARQTYKTAIGRGQQASLMEQQHPDVFQVAVGNIPSKEQVKIELVYATELSEDEENDSIRFHLPTCIGTRYGQAPESAAAALKNPFTNLFFSSTSKTPFLDITISVEALAPIAKIGCPSHTVSTELGPDPALPNFKELPFSNYARISLSSESALDKDFILTVKSAGLDTPRCVAELHPDPTHGTVALALTLVPRFKLPDLARQEFIVLVDRSGSMDGARIAAARRALVVMLRALPHKDSIFQIMSFGDRTSALWPAGSKPYNQETLEEATRHVDGMRANYGGTEIRAALQDCFATRSAGRPTSVFVLTDGEAWDLDAVLDKVKKAVAAAPDGAPLRVSVLGIGDQVSTAMCEGIARVGNGTCILVGEKETNFTGKIARLLKAARTPVISNISVDWGRPDAPAAEAPASEEDFEMVDEVHGAQKKTTLNIFDETVDPTHVDETAAPPPAPVVLPSFPAVQQSPFKIRNLFPGTRLNVYAILQGQSVPKTVILRGSTAEGAQIELPVAVTLSHLQNDPGAPPAIHALAARKIIQDLEDGQHVLVASLANPDDADLLARTVKASIVRLGKTYSISSAHTSFVAVDELESAPLAPALPEDMPEEAYTPTSAGGFYALSAMAAPRFSPTSLYGSVQPSLQASPSPAAPSAPPPPPPARAAAPPPPPPGRAPAQPGFTSYNYSAISSLVLTADRSILPHRTAFRHRMVAREEEEDSDDDMGFALCDDPDPSSFVATAAAEDPVENLARMQSFDGCFSSDVFAFVNPGLDIQSLRALFPTGAGDALVATVLAMAFLSTKLAADVERESWEGVYEKAKEYVQETLMGMGVDGFDVDGLEAEVATLIA